MLAMTSQILDWLKRHQHELSDIDFGDDEADAECRRVYPNGLYEMFCTYAKCRNIFRCDRHELSRIDIRCRRMYPTGRYEVYCRDAGRRRLYPVGRFEVYCRYDRRFSWQQFSWSD